MGQIEWQESSERQPEQKTLEEFCEERKIAWRSFASPPSNSKRLLVFIAQQALEDLDVFLAHDVRREHGGVLVGQPFYDPERMCYYLDICRAIPALDTEGSPVHLRFTPQAWEWISNIIEENHPNLMVVGWYHSHPGLGVFMSGTDRSTQRAFFYHPWNVAVVVDPIAGRSGWFWGGDCRVLTEEDLCAYQREGIEYQPLEPSIASKVGWLLPFFGLLFVGGTISWWIYRKRFKRSR